MWAQNIFGIKYIFFQMKIKIKNWKKKETEKRNTGMVSEIMSTLFWFHSELSLGTPLRTQQHIPF